jgi:hypothetical protein
MLPVGGDADPPIKIDNQIYFFLLKSLAHFLENLTVKSCFKEKIIT